MPAGSEKMFYSITEVAEQVGVEKYVIRFWESKFPEVKPDRKQGRRYYRDGDIKILLRIKDLLYKQGFTIAGAKKALRAKGAAADVSELGLGIGENFAPAVLGSDEPKLMSKPAAASVSKGRGRILSRFSFGGADEVEIIEDSATPMTDSKRKKIRAKIEEIEKLLG